jgi:hypothetical protein
VDNLEEIRAGVAAPPVFFPFSVSYFRGPDDALNLRLFEALAREGEPTLS